MLDLIPSLGPWLHRLADGQFAVATIVAASGSVPRPLGTSMLVTESGEVLGSLSGGCVEGAVVVLAQEAMDDGGPRLESYGFSAADAFAAGLTCGGRLDIHIQPVPAAVPGEPAHPLRTALLQLAEPGPDQPMALVRLLGSPGGAAVVLHHPATAGLAASPELSFLQGEAALQVEAILRLGGTGLVSIPGAGDCLPDRTGQPMDGSAVLVESRLAPPRMLVFGANDFSAALLPAAKPLGYHVTLVDARPAFAAQARFRTADEVGTAWSSHAQRVDALLDRGVRPERIAQLHSPLGLDIGAVTPAEVAVSVLAEFIAARTAAASHQPLRETSGPIHQPAAQPAGSPAHAPAPNNVKQQEIAWT